jgi:hypothetical protein
MTEMNTVKYTNCYNCIGFPESGYVVDYLQPLMQIKRCKVNTYLKKVIEISDLWSPDTRRRSNFHNVRPDFILNQ